MSRIEELLGELNNKRSSDRLKRVVNLIKISPGIELKEICERTGYSNKALSNYIKILRSHGVIDPTFSDSGVRLHGYKIVKERGINK